MKLLNFLRKKHEHKVKDKNRDDFFSNFKKENIAINPFNKLKEIVDQAKKVPEKDLLFKNLNQTAEKIKRHKKWIAFNQPIKLKKSEDKTFIEKLRDLSEKK